MSWEAVKSSGWIGPAGIVAVVAGIVWLVQLNIGYSMLTAATARNTTMIETNRQINNAQNVQLARTAEILKNIQKALERMEKK